MSDFFTKQIKPKYAVGYEDPVPFNCLILHLVFWPFEILKFNLAVYCCKQVFIHSQKKSLQTVQLILMSYRLRGIIHKNTRRRHGASTHLSDVPFQ